MPKAVLLSILRAKPASAKGNYVKGVTVATTMGPGIKIDLVADSRDGRVKRVIVSVQRQSDDRVALDQARR